MMWGWPLPHFMEGNHGDGTLQLLLAGIIMVINQKFFISGFKGLLHRAPNMDTLVALGSGASFKHICVVCDDGRTVKRATTRQSCPLTACAESENAGGAF